MSNNGWHAWPRVTQVEFDRKTTNGEWYNVYQLTRNKVTVTERATNKRFHVIITDPRGF